MMSLLPNWLKSQDEEVRTQEQENHKRKLLPKQYNDQSGRLEPTQCSLRGVIPRDSCMSGGGGRGREGEGGGPFHIMMSLLPNWLKSQDEEVGPQEQENHKRKLLPKQYNDQSGRLEPTQCSLRGVIPRDSCMSGGGGRGREGEGGGPFHIMMSLLPNWLKSQDEEVGPQEQENHKRKLLPKQYT